MGQIVVNVGSFDLTSHNGNTSYSSVRYFNIPANAGITACVATFAQHVNTGNFQGKAFSLNGAQAHPNTPWPTSGIALNASLLATGQNTFRAAVKSQAGLSARWSIGDIYLTITYNDVGGGGGGYDIGTLSVDKTSMTAGDSLTVSVGVASAGVYRDISIFLLPSSAGLAYVVQAHGSGAGSWTVTIPESWCETYSPNDPMFEIRIYVDAYIAGGTPVGNTAKMVAVNVPASAVPTIDDFTAVLNANGVDASITGYVQNYSKADIEIEGAAGALGSTIAAYEITGGGWSANTAASTFGPFPQAGDIVFTAKVTDTRGRTVTGTVTISVLSYGPAAFSNPEAWRSSDAGVKNGKGTYARLKSGVIYSSLDGQNSVTLKGRVYPKGGTAPAYTSMTPDTEWITGGGLLLVTKTYIAQMLVEDLISARIVEFTIPTKKTGISIMAGMQGIAFGKSAEIPGVAEFGWPIYNCPYEVGDILQTLNTSSPEDRWPDTEWESIAGRVLVGIDSTQTEFDTVGAEGGEKTHTLTEPEIPSHYHPLKYGGGVSPGSAPDVGAGSSAASETTGNAGGGQPHNNLQPYKVVYMWLRTA
jgi:hypothetical protein